MFGADPGAGKYLLSSASYIAEVLQSFFNFIFQFRDQQESLQADCWLAGTGSVIATNKQSGPDW